MKSKWSLGKNRAMSFTPLTPAMKANVVNKRWAIRVETHFTKSNCNSLILSVDTQYICLLT